MPLFLLMLAITASLLFALWLGFLLAKRMRRMEPRARLGTLAVVLLSLVLGWVVIGGLVPPGALRGQLASAMLLLHVFALCPVMIGFHLLGAASDAPDASTHRLT
jgi:hypothetical protein